MAAWVRLRFVQQPYGRLAEKDACLTGTWLRQFGTAGPKRSKLSKYDFTCYEVMNCRVVLRLIPIADHLNVCECDVELIV